MRRTSTIAAALGGALIVLAGLWLLVAPGMLVKYPSDLDKTAVAKGRFTLFIDPETATPRFPGPMVVPLDIRRNVRVTESSGSRAVVRERSVERIGPLAPQTIRQQYVFDRGSLKGAGGPKSWSYSPANATDRSGDYTINLPFGTGSGPYRIWKNEVGRTYAFHQAGPRIRRDGLTLIPMEGSLDGVPAVDAFIDQLATAGITRTLTPAQLAAQLKAKGIDLAALKASVLPRLSPAERAQAQALLARPVPVRYFISVRTRLLVEPTTGAIVSLDRVRQTLTATPDLVALAPLTRLLSAPPVASFPAVRAALAKLQALGSEPPAKVFTMTYGQTPASVADIAAYTKSKADQIVVAKRTLPGALAALGLLALLIAGGLRLTGRRPPRSAATRPPRGTGAPPLAHA
jgi:hypothetical protein